jgi:T5orf172 domain
MAEMNADEVLAALGVEITPLKTSARTPREERIIAGFEDIIKFREEQGRAPRHGSHGEGHDIFERLYAVRLDQLRQLPEAQSLLAPFDRFGLLSATTSTAGSTDAMNEDAVLAALGMDVNEITQLRHVRSNLDRREAEEIADRTRCADFASFKHRFEQIEQDLKSSVRKTIRFGRDASIEPGNFFILDGQIAYVAEVGEITKTVSSGHDDARLRVIYSNGTESNLLLRSLQKALYKDEMGRRITEPNMGPLFGDTPKSDDIASGTIYVLRSLSTQPYVAEHRELIHKIGVTGGAVEARIANAAKDATYLLADVEVVATYKLHNINRFKLEQIFHRLFAPAQLDLTIDDRFGNPVKPREWFLVPLHVINDAVVRIQDGTVIDVIYDPQTASLVTSRPKP